MDAQRLKILEPLSNLLGAKAFHFALLPKPWIDYWEENNAAALSELRASINKIVPWEDILAPFKNKGPASYWIAILETALLMPLRPCSPSVRPILHAREQCRWCGRSRFLCCSFDRRTHARRGRAFSRASYWRPSAPGCVRDCDRPATNAAFEATRGRAFLRPHRGDRHCRPPLSVLPLAMPVKDWISDFRPCRLKLQPAIHHMGPSLARGSTLARMPWGVRMNARRKQRATAPASWRG